ncbi:MAG: nitroreductase family protein [Acidimicrobiia bacterium]|nr:nitroreductase family protein [Acidimicrobiia bacterium]
MSSVYDFILGLRAIREYKPEPLSDEDLSAILEAARWTGSSKNRQDWAFVIVNDPSRLRELAKHGDFTSPVLRSAATVVLVQEEGGNMFDIGRAAQNIMLAAKAIGVASCPITLHREEGAKEFVGAVDGARVRYAVALGYPAEGAKPARFGGRKSREEVIRNDRI